MATYGTDLALLATGSDADGSGTWLELIAPYALGGGPAQDGENVIQGTDCVSQGLGNKTGLGFSIVFDAGSDISSSFATGATPDVVMAWVYFAVGSDLKSLADGGHRYVIASDNVNLAADSWTISGNDSPPNPYGGWWNVAVDPTKTPDYTDGDSGNNGAYRYFGSIVNITLKITKGTPHAVDAQRFGRGEIFCTGTGATFTLMAADNDAIANRWGLLQDTGGSGFLWKGLMSLGQSGTSTTFTASNQNIKIDDAFVTYTAFSKIEIRHASTSVTWTNIIFSAAGTVAPGQFEMVENATFVMTGGGFNNMDSFVFLTNATLTAVTFVGCGEIDHGASTFADCVIEGYEGTANTSALVYNPATSTAGLFDGTSFAMGTALTHAIEFGLSSPTTIDLTDVVFTGYNASNGNNDSMVHILRTTGTVTINVSGGTTPSYRTEGATVLIVNAVTISDTVRDVEDNSLVDGARVFWRAATTGGDLAADQSFSITSSGTTATGTHIAHGLAVNDKIYIEDAVEYQYNFTVTIVSVPTDDTFTYTMPSSAATPATGSPIYSFVILDAATTGSGIVEDTGFNFTNDQDVVGNVRRGTATPFYKTGKVIGTITSAGLVRTTLMVSDA